MKIIYMNTNNKYFITLQGYNKPSNIVAIFLKINLAQYNDLLRSYGAYLDIDGNMYFLNKDQVTKAVNDLNKIKKNKK